MRLRGIPGVLAAALLASGVTASGQQPTIRPAPALRVEYTHFTLPNGLQVILHEDHSVPIVTVNTWYHVGSAHEKPGRTGFAHLFEHLMFEGSAHVKEGEFDSLLEMAGGDNNGSTTGDRTNYWITVPSNALELALFLESDRMGFLLESMSPERVDGQRDIVKNERRQSYENQPYGMASIEIDHLLYPEGHPYRWPTIGYMEDLTAASYEDVVEFFKRYYGPNNASLVVAGDIDSTVTHGLVEKWFGEIKRGPFVEPLAPPAAFLTEVKKKTIQDRVQLPRIYLTWLTPAQYAPGDAGLDLVAQVLSGGKNSRLYKRLVYDLQIAQDAAAYQVSGPLGSTFQIIVTARVGGAGAETPQAAIEQVKKIVDEELVKLQQNPPTEREIERALNQFEASFFDSMEQVGGFGGKADLLNGYFYSTGDPDYFNEDLARYRALTASDVQSFARQFLPLDRRVELIVEPAGQKAAQP